MPAVIASLSFGAALIRAAVRYAGQNGCEMMMSASCRWRSSTHPAPSYAWCMTRWKTDSGEQFVNWWCPVKAGGCSYLVRGDDVFNTLLLQERSKSQGAANTPKKCPWLEAYRRWRWRCGAICILRDVRQGVPYARGRVSSSGIWIKCTNNLRVRYVAERYKQRRRATHGIHPSGRLW